MRGKVEQVADMALKMKSVVLYNPESDLAACYERSGLEWKMVIRKKKVDFEQSCTIVSEEEFKNTFIKYAKKGWDLHLYSKALIVSSNVKVLPF